MGTLKENYDLYADQAPKPRFPRDAHKHEPECICDAQHLLHYGHRTDCPAKGKELAKVNARYARKQKLEKGYLP